MKGLYIFLAIIIGYLFGCIQTSYLIGFFRKGIDIRKHGNGNAGASNTVLVLGWKDGIIVALCDIFKTVGAVSLMKIFMLKGGLSLNEQILIIYLTGAFTIIGHNFPFYLKFTGGKGTASLIGLLIALDWRLATAGILSIVLTTLITGYIALGTALLMISFTVLTYHLGFGIEATIVAVLLFLLSLYKHLPNYKRILQKEEMNLYNILRKRKEKN